MVNSQAGEDFEIIRGRLEDGVEGFFGDVDVAPLVLDGELDDVVAEGGLSLELGEVQSHGREAHLHDSVVTEVEVAVLPVAPASIVQVR